MPDFTVIPSIDVLRQRPALRVLEAQFGADATLGALRAAASAVRTAIAGGDSSIATEAIVLAAVAAGREVIVSRGELVEIGGGFRVPDVMAQSGAVLREVGTTNKTRVADYAAAISERTALILRVHPSNFRIEGFTERPRLDQIVEVGQKCNVRSEERRVGKEW